MRAANLARLAAFGLVVALAGCAPGKSIVTVTLDADSPTAIIDHLTVMATDTNSHKSGSVGSIAVGAAIPPAYTFSLRFDASVRSTVHLAITAVDGSGTAIGTAGGDVAVKPSATVHLGLTLTPVVAPPPGSTLAFMAQPTDTLAKATIPTVSVVVQDGNGATVTTTNIPITLAIGINPASGTLGGTLTVNATGGVASFGDLSIDQPGMGYTLVATATGLTDATSMPFAIRTTGWVPVNAGLTGGVIHDLVLDPKHPATLYAATEDNGVWRTLDGGSNWTRASTGLPARHPVDALAVDPVTTTTLWATLGDQGVYKSTDGGNSWTQSTSTVVHSGDTAAIAVDPAHPSNVYAAASRAVVRTLDGGATWNSLGSGATYADGPRSIAINPTTGDVWLAQFGDGLWKLTYGGAGFTLADGTGGNIIPGTHPYMKCIAFDPNDPAKMYASGDLQPQATVYVSSDGGANWTPAAAAPATAPVKMRGFVGPGGVVRMYGAIPESGIISTPTATNRWDYNSAGITNASAVAVDPTTANLVYAATKTGVTRSTDSFNFTGVNNGLVGYGLYSLAVDPKNGTKIYTGGTNGVFRSSDGAQSWSAPSSPMPGAVKIYGLAVDYTDDKIYLGTDNYGFLSADFGANWSSVTYGTTINPLYSLAASPSMSNTFWAGGTSGQAYTTSGGATWTAAGAGLPASSRINAIAVHPTDPMTVFAATSAAGVYKTTNAGAMWTASSTGLGSMKIAALVIDPSDGNNLLAATADMGVYRSMDGGATWSASSSGLTTMNTIAIAVAPSQTNTLYLATDAGVFQTLDGGNSWAAYSAGLAGADIDAIAVDPTDPLTAYVATWNEGVLKNVTQ